MDHEPSGIRVSIYKDGGRSWSNGGISDLHDEATLILPDGGPFKPTFDAPAIKIVGNTAGTIKAIPYDDTKWRHEKPIGPMMGGSYIATSDSRFSEETERVLGARFYGAVPLHDRFETQSDYDRNWP